MAEVNANNVATVGQAAVIFGEVAALAHAARGLVGGVLADGREGFDHGRVAAVLALVNQAGMLADHGAAKLGAAREVGGVEAWMLPGCQASAEREAAAA